MKMRKKPICVYCRVLPGVEDEHVFPDSWYPATTPTTVQRLTVPSCKPCNRKWKALEERIGPDMQMICSREVYGAVGVNAKQSRSWSVQHARDTEDARHRAGKALKILHTMAWPNAHPGAPVAQVRIGARARLASPARVIQPADLHALAEKFVRGLYYFETDGLTLPEIIIKAKIIPNALVRVVTPLKQDWARVINTFRQLPIATQLSPGLEYRRFFGAHDFQGWDFLLWGQFEIFAMSQPLILRAAR